MRYVLPAAPNVCSYTTLAKMNCQISTCWTTDIGCYFHKTFLWSIPTPHATRGQFEYLFRLSCFSCLVLFVFLTLFFKTNFLNVMLTTTTAFIASLDLCGWMKRSLEQLRSRYDAKLQHVFLTFSSGVFLQKCQNWPRERKDVLWKQNQ